MDSTATQSKNHILAALPPEDYARLAAHLEPVQYERDHVFYGAGDRMDYAYFPTGMMTSLVSQMSDGGSIEVGVVGFEGMVGLSLVLGVDRTPYECMVQLPGEGTRVKAGVLVEEFKRGGALHDRLLRYTQGLLLQTSQIAACNRSHRVEERLARWLLMCRDRVASDELPLTQEFIAMMLGTRRAGVTEAAIVLQAEDFIKYSRGRITILDRPALEDFSCECYSIIREEFDRITG